MSSVFTCNQPFRSNLIHSVANVPLNVCQKRKEKKRMHLRPASQLYLVRFCFFTKTYNPCGVMTSLLPCPFRYNCGAHCMLNTHALPCHPWLSGCWISVFSFLLLLCHTSFFACLPGLNLRLSCGCMPQLSLADGTSRLAYLPFSAIIQ